MIKGFLMVQELKAYGVEYVTLENHITLDSPESLIPFAFNMLLPEVENKRRAENTITGMRQAVRQGRFLWKAPLGYQNDTLSKTIIVDSNRASLVKFAFDMYSAGIYSIEQIRAMLKEKGLITSKQMLINTIRNPIYIGKVILKAWKNEPEELIEGLHEPLIDESTFNTCNDVLNGKKKKLLRQNTRQKKLPLRGFLTCCKSGWKLTGSNSKSRNGSLHSYYHCQKGCKERFRADEANEILFSF